MSFAIIIMFLRHDIHCRSIVVSTNIIRVSLKIKRSRSTKEIKNVNTQDKITIDLRALKPNIDEAILVIELDLGVTFASCDSVVVVLVKKSNF